MSKLLLIDGLNMAYRNQHTIGHLTKEDGTPSGALYGTARGLISMIKQFEPDYVAACWEGGENDRKEIDPSYKAHRARNDDETFWHQVRAFQQFVWHLGLGNATMPGKEADDIIASYATAASCAGDETIIISEDHDFYQCLCRAESAHLDYPEGEDNLPIGPISMFKPMRKEFIDVDYWQSWNDGILPSHYPWVQAIAGCDTDGVQGIRGIGEKTARKFVLRHGGLLRAIEVEPKLTPHRDQIMRNLQLVKLDNWLDLPHSYTEFSWDPNHPNGLMDIFLESWEFPSIVKQIQSLQEA